MKTEEAGHNDANLEAMLDKFHISNPEGLIVITQIRSKGFASVLNAIKLHLFAATLTANSVKVKPTWNVNMFLYKE